MNINSLWRLPWKLKDALRAVRRDVADSRRMTAELARMIATLKTVIAE
jgi:hypothetical protein